MASNLADRSRRPANLSPHWPSRQTMDDNYRKSPVREGNVTKSPNEYCCAPGEERVSRRYESAPSKPLYHRQGDTVNDHELSNLMEEKTSDEGSVTEIDTNENEHGDVHASRHACDPVSKKYENSTREYSPCAYGKCAGAHRVNKSEELDVDDVGNTESGVICQSAVPVIRNQRHFQNYGNPVNLPQALVAMRKLERLKELQRRRDHSERFYSQEIRRLIGENFFAENAAILTAPVKNRERIAITGTRANDEAQQQNGVDQRNRGGGYTKELEPNGTMTTITRLYCGCVEESTIPIFSTSIGHVKKCESHRYQERPTSKLAPPYPQELPYRTAENPGKLENLNACQSMRTRASKNFADCGAYRNSTKSASRDLEFWDERKPIRSRRSPRNLSPDRTKSPARKCSDTSSN